MVIWPERVHADGTKAGMRRYCVMNKITLITAAVAALAAATVAAQTGDHTNGSSKSDIVMASLQAQDTPLRGAAQKQSSTDIVQIRYVIGPEQPADSCEQAAWPYYPVDCLQRVEQSGL